MLVGTAFLMSSSQNRQDIKAIAKADRLATTVRGLLDSALLDILRDNENPYSVVALPQLGFAICTAPMGFQVVATKVRTTHGKYPSTIQNSAPRTVSFIDI